MCGEEQSDACRTEQLDECKLRIIEKWTALDIDFATFNEASPPYWKKGLVGTRECRLMVCCVTAGLYLVDEGQEGVWRLGRHCPGRRRVGLLSKNPTYDHPPLMFMTRPRFDQVSS